MKGKKEKEKREEREKMLGELAGCPRNMAVVGGERPLQLHPQYDC